jgi:ABC-type transporter Mla subunit MlaD
VELSEEKSNGAGVDPPDAAELEKVRSILFGEKDRQIQQRLKDLEEFILQVQEQGRRQLDAELSALRSTVSEGGKTLSDELRQEAASRQAQFEELERLMADYSNASKEGFERVDERLESVQKAARQGQSELEKKTQSDLERLSADLLQRLSDTAQKLEKTKSDRAQLAELFEHLASVLRK